MSTVTGAGPAAAPGGAVRAVELAIGWMTCASCAARVEKKLSRLDGVTASVNLAYVLSGPARTQWQHQIPAVTQERWSMTFRTLRHATAGTR